MIALSPEVKALITERANPHCIVWVHAMAGLWGISHTHDLDEPVPLSEAVPVRLRYAGEQIITDRALSMKTTQAGHHTALRFMFKDGTFFEVEVPGVSVITGLDRTAEISRVEVSSLCS
jgi:hypothetical protein